MKDELPCCYIDFIIIFPAIGVTRISLAIDFIDFETL